MASRKEYEMLFQLNAQLGSNYSSTFKTAEGALNSMQGEINALGRAQSDISAYQKQEAAIENNRKKLQLFKEQYENIQKEMQETGKFSSALENRLLAKQQQIDKTSKSLEEQTSKLNHMGASLRETGIDTSNLSGETSRLGSQMEVLKTKQVEIAETAAAYGESASTAFITAGEALATAGLAVGLNKIYKEYLACIDAAMEYEVVMAGVRRTVGGSNEELFWMSEQFRELSLNMPITTSELGKIAETAGQLGIARSEVTEFTKVMAMLSTTTDLSSDNAATMIAQFSNITGTKDYERLGAVVADLGDATATTASRVVEMSQGMAASATIAGFAETDILAIAASVGSLGIESQAGSTAMSTLISTLYKSVETGDKLKEFASVANMSAEEFATSWREKPVMAMDAFIQGLNATERNGKSAMVILDELGITNVRQTKAILGLASAGDLLTNTIGQANRAWQENTALQEKANIMYDTTHSKLMMKENAYKALSVTLGELATPALNKLYDIEIEVLKSITEFVEKNPELVQTILSTGGALAAGTTALVGYATAAKLVKSIELASAFASPAGAVIVAVTAVTALTAGYVDLQSANKSLNDEARYLTESSREQLYQLERLKNEYNEASEVYNQNSSELNALRWEIEDLEAEYKRSKQTLSEFSSEINKSVDANQELIQSYRDSIDAIGKGEWQTVTLINKLAELASQNETTATSQAQMKAIIDSLNKSLPELNLNYDSVIEKGSGFIDGLKGVAEAQAAQERYNESFSKYVTFLNEEAELETKALQTKNSMATAQERYVKAKEAYMELLAMRVKYDQSGFAVFGMLFTEERKELKAAEKALGEYQTALDKVNAELAENRSEQEKVNQEIERFAGAGKVASDSGIALHTVIAEVNLEVSKLTTAYQESYEAAVASLSGQYNLWDEAAEIMETSAGEISYALETQAQYWKEYNTSLSSLGARSDDIEGLAELLSSFADGSENSVNVISGLAMATDSELKAMVENWQAVKAEQQTVAESLAQLETEFTSSMAILQNELETTIAEMNLSEEAALSGISTIEGFIEGSKSMLPTVMAVYSDMAATAIGSINAQLNSTGTVTAPSVLSASQQNKPLTAATSGSNAGTLGGIPNIEINYQITGVGSVPELESMLATRDSSLKQTILDTIEEFYDNQRRAAYY